MSVLGESDESIRDYQSTHTSSSNSHQHGLVINETRGTPVTAKYDFEFPRFTSLPHGNFILQPFGKKFNCFCL